VTSDDYTVCGRLLSVTATDITTYKWNEEDQLTAVTTYDTYADYAAGTGGVETQFGYDPFGDMVSETSRGTTQYFAYDGQDVVLVFSGGTLIQRQLNGPAADQVLAVEEVGGENPGVNWLLADDDSERCLAGLLDISRAGHPRPHNFHQWIMATFGPGLANVFMLPYNFKVWAHPLEMLDVQWVGERVAPPDARSGVSWGPNRTFRFPVRGGTGAIWRSCAQCLPQGRLRFDTTVTAIDLDHRQVTTATGERYRYDVLISSIPLTELIRCSGQSQFARRAECGLLYSSSNIFGIGLSGKPAEELRTKSWVYFPEDNCPFYRVTVFSNYSSNNVPDSEKHWSLIAEVSESQYKPVDRSRLLEQVIAGLLATGFVTRRDAIVSTWQYRAPYGYPTPGLERDAVLAEIVPFFESQGVYSRGRFGLWKYEVSNQDHSFMQGVEIVERLVNGRQEITAFDARCANGRKHAWPFVQWETGLSARVNSGEADGVGKK
jgi:YD repeat-containing protein